MKIIRYKLNEGLTPEGTPDSKYYAFDWDDNIVSMPTRIILKNEDGEEVGMSTEDFAHYRSKIGKEDFDYNGEKIVGFAEDPFKNFGTKGDKQFIVDAMLATEGPAWSDFVEAINNGSIFSIVTARGHTPSVLKEATYNYIVSNHNGLDSNELIRNLRKYRDIADDEDMSDSELIKEYLDMCKFYPVSYNNEKGASNPEQAKIEALEEFTRYVKHMSHKIQKKAFMKNKISNYFVPKIGFSDDDLKNVEKVKSHFEQDPENIITTYSTAGGIKKKF
jgi:hypothetical protein